jgi:putative ABC transport system permease protein
VPIHKDERATSLTTFVFSADISGVRKLILTLRLGFFSLLLHKLRAGLAVLGILIGVTAVIWLVAVGEGIRNEAERQIQGLGANNIIVRSVKPPAESGGSGGFNMLVYGLTRDDYQRITKALTAEVLEQSVPMKEFRRKAWNMSTGHNTEVQLVGCWPAYLTLNHLTLDRGRFITSRDLEQTAKVVVLGEETAKRLFPGENPMGQHVLIADNFFSVVGVTQARDPSAAIGGSLDSRDYNVDAYIPLATWETHIGDQNRSLGSGTFSAEEVELSQITLTVRDIDMVEQVADVIKGLLNIHHEKLDYAIVIPKELLRKAQLVRMMFNILLIIIAGISLLVGGIGIMNIMLATVTERTREIGIRRALGATRGDIILQFLIESLVLTGIGGALGVALGVACGPAVNSVRWLMRTFTPGAVAEVDKNIMNMQPDLAWWSIATAFLISVIVGLVFGLYPAYRAAMMDPIEALRHE